MRIIKIKKIMVLTGLLFSFTGYANNVTHLQQAYPHQIVAITQQTITWQDGTKMAVDDGNHAKTAQQKLEDPSLLDQVKAQYISGAPVDSAHYQPNSDAGRVRYVPFFKKMYGESEQAVKDKLTTIYWMPAFFGKKYPLLVTTVNGVDKKLTAVSHDLELLAKQHPEYLTYLDSPSGTFDWRVIANTHRLSMHSFGMTIDLNSQLLNYWQWDLQKQHVAISEEAPLTYHNDIPWAIVPIFEKHGFIWGGKWLHYDTMHFEYRPELLIQ